MSSLIPPEFRKLRSSGSPITIKPPERACTMLSMPSRSAVPGAIISRAFIKPGSALPSVSISSPDRRATVFDSRAFTIPLASPPAPARSRSGGDRVPPRALAGHRQRQRSRQRGRLAGPRPAVHRRDRRAAAVPGGLLQAPLGMPHPAQLAGQPQLAEARPWRAPQGYAAARARDRKRDGEVRAGLLQAHASHNVHEHVAAGRREAAMAGEA